MTDTPTVTALTPEGESVSIDEAGLSLLLQRCSMLTNMLTNAIEASDPGTDDQYDQGYLHGLIHATQWIMSGTTPFEGIADG